MMRAYKIMMSGLVWGCMIPAAFASDSHRRTPIVQAVEKALPCVVNIGTERTIRVTRNNAQQRQWDDMMDQMLRQMEARPVVPSDMHLTHSLGSGVIVDPSGYILTNYHVIERATTIRVTLSDKETYLAHVVAGDEINDLALIKIEPQSPLQAVHLARDGDLLLGETVIVLGNPFGLGHSVTVGVLSAKDREARSGDQVIFRDILQTDAAVNPGNSGGPLINVDAELIGISTAIQETAQNIGFAVPVNRARALLVSWLAPRTLNRVLLGFDLEENAGSLQVTRVDEKSPAANSGLRAGDRLLGVNGAGVENLFDFVKTMLHARPGDTVSFGYQRGEQLGVASVQLTGVPTPPAKELLRDRLGMVPGAPSPRVRGITIDQILPEGPLSKAGVGAAPDLVLTSINGLIISSLEDAALALEKVRPGDPVRVVVLHSQVNGSATRVFFRSLQFPAG